MTRYFGYDLLRVMLALYRYETLSFTMAFDAGVMEASNPVKSTSDQKSPGPVRYLSTIDAYNQWAEVRHPSSSIRRSDSIEIQISGI